MSHKRVFIITSINARKFHKAVINKDLRYYRPHIAQSLHHVLWQTICFVALCGICYANSVYHLISIKNLANISLFHTTHLSQVICTLTKVMYAFGVRKHTILDPTWPLHNAVFQLMCIHFSHGHGVSHGIGTNAYQLVNVYNDK